MEPQKISVSTTTQTDKIVELRNEREISRAVQYAEEELRLHLELGTADTEAKALLIKNILEIVQNIGLGQTNLEIDRSIDSLLRAVGDLDQAVADLIAGAEAQVTELAAELEQLQSGGGGMPPTTTIVDIDAELKRRMDARKVVAEKQEEYEDELAQMKIRFDVLGDLLKNGDASAETKSERQELESKIFGLETTVGTVIEKMADCDYRIQQLIAYKNAIQLLNQGLPQGIIGEKLFDFSKK